MARSRITLFWVVERTLAMTTKTWPCAFRNWLAKKWSNLAPLLCRSCRTHCCCSAVGSLGIARPSAADISLTIWSSRE
jgi:hypothetical protein